MRARARCGDSGGNVMAGNPESSDPVCVRCGVRKSRHVRGFCRDAPVFQRQPPWEVQPGCCKCRYGEDHVWHCAHSGGGAVKEAVKSGGSV